VRIKALFSLAALGYAGLALAQATPAQNVVVEERKTETVTVVVKETPKPPAFVFELHGFTSVSMYLQDAQFGLNNNNPANGQAALNVLKTFEQDKPIFGADVRATRLNFSVRGPEVLGGATPKAVVEIDFFGGDSPGGFGDVSVWPRLRLAYTELNWGNGAHIIQLGQQNMLTVGLIPQSLRGIAFPMTFTAGTVGWRQPGIFGYHTFGKDTRFEFAWSIQRSSWANNAQVGFINAGTASGLPAFEARAKLMFGKVMDFWVSGHWQQADRNGPGATEITTLPSATTSTITTALGTVGLKLDTGMLVLAGSAWWGKNAGPLLGNVLQFSTAATGKDIWGYGAWGQAGLNFSKEFSLWYTFGIDHPSYDDIFTTNSAVMRNVNQIGMVRYQSGGFAFGVEWLNSRTTYNHAAQITSILVGSSSGSVAVPVSPVITTGPLAGTGTPIITTNSSAQIASDNVLIGNQFTLTANYYF
jgi:hypothetical protein